MPVAAPPAPIVLPGWFQPWAVWAIRGKNGPRPNSAPAEIPKWALWYPAWVQWRLKAPPRPVRPAVLPTKIPDWAWDEIEKTLKTLNPAPPPPPPPPPPVPIPADSWRLPYPVLYTARGWEDDNSFRDTDIALNLMRDAGVGTVALQGGAFDSLASLEATADRVRSKGMRVAVWGAADTRDAGYLAAAKASGYIPQVEGKYEFDRALANLEDGVGRGLSLSIVTTSAGLDHFKLRNQGTAQEQWTTEEAERLIAAGCTNAQAECYGADMSPGHVDAALFEAVNRGMYYVVPCLSYRGIVPTRSGRRISVFLAEPMTDGQYQQLKALA